MEPCSGLSYNLEQAPQLILFFFFFGNVCFIILFMHLNKKFCEPENIYVTA